MDSLNEFFISYGYWGMGIAAFLAGTFFPFSSEAVMAALLVSSSMDPVLTVVSGTIGNVLGSMVNYFIGSLCKPETVSRLFRIKPYGDRSTLREALWGLDGFLCVYTDIRYCYQYRTWYIESKCLGYTPLNVHRKMHPLYCCSLFRLGFNISLFI